MTECLPALASLCGPRPAASGITWTATRTAKAAALALVFHLADGHSGTVGFFSTQRALHWGTYLETHARRCFRVAQLGEADTPQQIATQAGSAIHRALRRNG
jgi:hypothetical protein